jgi:hypothetical protein
VHVAREVCLGMEPLQAHAAKFILADSPDPHTSSACAAVTWTDLSTLLAVPEEEAIHEMKLAAARLSAIASGSAAPPPSDVRICVTGSALAVMWASQLYRNP